MDSLDENVLPRAEKMNIMRDVRDGHLTIAAGNTPRALPRALPRSILCRSRIAFGWRSFHDQLNAQSDGYVFSMLFMVLIQVRTFECQHSYFPFNSVWFILIQNQKAWY